MNQGWRVVRVFISSTFLDMQAERDYLVRFVIPRLRREVLKWRIHLVEIDLRWGVSEDQESLQACERIIDECRPRFICILGERYGSYASGQNRSITEAEIRHFLCDHCRIQHKHLFFFPYFRNPTALSGITPEDLKDTTYIEKDPENQIKVNRLKKFIEDLGFVPHVYPARWDNESRSFADLEVFGDYVFEDLLKSIEDEFGKPLNNIVDAITEERSSMEAFTECRSRDFILGSRKHIFEKIVSFSESDGSPNILVVTGGPGMGKSALLSFFYRHYVTFHSDDMLIPHFVGASSRSSDLCTMLNRLCYEISGNSEEDSSFIQEPEEVVRRFSRLLVSCQDRIVILIDSIDDLDDTDNAHEMSWLPHCLPGGVRVIISSSTDEILLHRKDAERCCLEKLEPDDKRAMIQDYLDRFKKTMDEKQLSELINKDESDKPLYLRMALEELRTLGSRNSLYSNVFELQNAVKPLFSWVLERLSQSPFFKDTNNRNVGAVLVKEYICCLASSRYGLSETELIDLLIPRVYSCQQEENVPQDHEQISKKLRGNIAALQHLLMPYLMFRGEKLDFIHSLLKEAVREKWLSNDYMRRPYHRYLANYFKNLDLERSTRFFDEYPYHLIECQDWDLLAGTIASVMLCNYAWINGRFYEWMEYWNAIPNKYNPAIWFLSSEKLLENKSKEPLENGWLLYHLGRFLTEMAAKKGNDADCYRVGHLFLVRSLRLHCLDLGKCNTAVAEVLSLMALNRWFRGERNIAQRIYEKVRKIRIDKLGWDHPRVARVDTNLGSLYFLKGDRRSALAFYNEALNIYSRTMMKGEEVSNLYNNLGIFYTECSKYEQALVHFSRGLEILDCSYESERQLTSRISILFNMAGLYIRLNMIDLARMRLITASDIAKKVPYSPWGEAIDKKMSSLGL